MELIISRNAILTRKILRTINGVRLSDTLRNVRYVCQFNDRINDNKNLLTSTNASSRSLCTFTRWQAHELPFKTISVSYYSTVSENNPTKNSNEAVDPVKKVSIFQKMKQLTKDYWHILIPVHLVTSLGWGAMCYLAAKNGVDIVEIMEYLHLSQKYIDIIQNSKAGDLAVTYALYKILTPLRYTVTVGGTTLSIRYLDKLGYLKFKKQTTENIRKISSRQRHQTNATASTKKTEVKVPHQKIRPNTDKQKISDRM